MAQFKILTPYPGTHTFARLAEQGRILHYDWGRYDLYHVAIEPAGMTAAQLEEGTWRAYKAFYGRKPRAQRLWRHVRTGMPPIFTAATGRPRPPPSRSRPTRPTSSSFW